MARLASLLLAPVFASSLLLLAMPSCSKQGEGERCDTANNNDDCESGLICQNVQTYWLCCPPPGTQPSVAACFAGTAPVAEAGADSAMEASIDAPQEAEGDSSTADAPQEAADDASEDVQDGAPADTADESTADAAGD